MTFVGITIHRVIVHEPLVIHTTLQGTSIFGKRHNHDNNDLSLNKTSIATLHLQADNIHTQRLNTPQGIHASQSFVTTSLTQPHDSIENFKFYLD